MFDSTLFIAAFLMIGMLVMLASGIWVALALMGIGFLGLALFTSAPVGDVLASTVWGASNSWALAALPLFIWMGEILFRSRLSSDMFKGLAPWLSWLPGRLLHVNIIGCGIFAAVSGSSAATAATIGKMAVPELQKRGYDMPSVIGTLAGSGTLGLLIPPSIILIVYGVATDQSIARLFVAGILPGALLVGLFMGYVVIWALLNRDKVPADDMKQGLIEKIQGVKRLAPVILLIAGVIGSIYSGVASPTDAAAVGVALALVFSWMSGDLTWESFRDGLIGATRTSCMIALILAGGCLPDCGHGLYPDPKPIGGMDRGDESVALYPVGRVNSLFRDIGLFSGWDFRGGADHIGDPAHGGTGWDRYPLVWYFHRDRCGNVPNHPTGWI